MLRNRRNIQNMRATNSRVFIYHKDKKFFEQVILPYLRNKKDKTFLDHSLIGDDLAAYLEPWAYTQLNNV